MHEGGAPTHANCHADSCIMHASDQSLTIVGGLTSAYLHLHLQILISRFPVRSSNFLLSSVVYSTCIGSARLAAPRYLVFPSFLWTFIFIDIQQSQHGVCVYVVFLFLLCLASDTADRSLTMSCHSFFLPHSFDHAAAYSTVQHITHTQNSWIRGRNQALLSSSPKVFGTVSRSAFAIVPHFDLGRLRVHTFWEILGEFLN